MVKAIKIVIELIGWLTITAGTTTAFGGVSLLIYSEWENRTVALAILVVGFVLRAIWATRISIKYGTMEWLSGIKRIS